MSKYYKLTKELKSRKNQQFYFKSNIIFAAGVMKVINKVI